MSSKFWGKNMHNTVLNNKDKIAKLDRPGTYLNTYVDLLLLMSLTSTDHLMLSTTEATFKNRFFEPSRKIKA
jgi:hypothetical protein